MVNCQKIKALMVENNLTGKEVAKLMNIADKTLYRKLKTGFFNSIEMNQLIRILDIKNPDEIFFDNKVN